MGNEVLNSFSSNNFFNKSKIFGENGENKFLWNTTTFQKKGSSCAKNEYNLFFYQKLDAKYFHTK